MEPFADVAGFFASHRSLRFEADVHDCEVVGEIPPSLRGSLYRIGPDSQYPTREGDVIINGEGMVSAFTIADGHVDFRCRYVRTARYLAQRAARRRLYGGYRNPHTDDPAAPAGDRDNTGNTYAFFHHGRLFALREDSHPHEIDPDTLGTLPVHDFGGTLASLSLTAHPKIDPETGEWWSFGLFSRRRFDGDMALQVIGRDGRLIRQEEFQAPYPGLAHDFAVTQRHVVFPVMPLTVDLERVREGGDFYAYDRSLPSMWGIMPRRGPTADIRWFSAPGCFSGHVMNAFSEGDSVHVDATISPGNGFRFFRATDGSTTDPMKAIATVSRLTFDLTDPEDRVEVRPFPGARGEMPRCDDRYQTRPYRYGFMKCRDGIARLDWATGERTVHPIAPEAGNAQEPIFAPRAPDSPEGDGYILCVVNLPGNLAELRIIDATDMAAPPLAVVKLPFDQPFAFHGCFVAR